MFLYEIRQLMIQCCMKPKTPFGIGHFQASGLFQVSDELLKRHVPPDQQYTLFTYIWTF